MNDSNEENTDNVTVLEPSETTTRKRSTKKKAAKKGKGKGKAAKSKTTKTASGPRAPREGRYLYRLAANVKVEEADPKTHRGAVLHAIRKTKNHEANRAQIMAEVEKQGKLNSRMKLGSLVSFILWQMVKKKELVRKANVKVAA